MNKKLLLIVVVVVLLVLLVFAGWSWCGEHPMNAPLHSTSMFDGAD